MTNLLRALKFSPDQPRHPKGSSKGGQWSKVGPGGSGNLNPMRFTESMRAAMREGIAQSAKHRGKYKDPTEALSKIASIEEEMTKNYNNKATDKLHKLKNGEWTPERRDMHTKILERRFKDADKKFKPPEGEKPHVLLLAGKPGAGKSQFGKKLKIYDPDRYFVLDSDSFKEEFPEYDPERPGYVHREASDLMDTAGIIARAKGLNIVYDMTMKKSPDALVKMFKDHGYVVEMHHMKVAQETSQMRAVYRWNNDHKDGKMGRLVPPSVIAEMTDTDTVFTKAKEQADHWTEYTHEQLGKPIRVGAGGRYAVRKAIKALTGLFSKGVDPWQLV